VDEKRSKLLDDRPSKAWDIYCVALEDVRMGNIGNPFTVLILLLLLVERISASTLASAVVLSFILSLLYVFGFLAISGNVVEWIAFIVIWIFGFVGTYKMLVWRWYKNDKETRKKIMRYRIELGYEEKS
jgi:hypothetical protein